MNEEDYIIQIPDNTRTRILPNSGIDYRQKLDYVKQPFDFVKRYYNSEGFKQRFHDNFPIAFREYYDSIYDEYNKLSEPPYLLRAIKQPLELKGFISTSKRLNENAEYNSGSKYITIGDHENKKEYDGVIAHELGHALDFSIKVNRGKNYFNGYFYDYPIRYSHIWPVFRKSKSYLNFRNKEHIDNDSWNRYPNLYYELEHDGQPGESYADLMRLRYLLDKYHIYDSTKKNNPFKQEHLDKIRKKEPKLRIFENFDEDDIIKMMNTVAQNNSY